MLRRQRKVSPQEKSDTEKNEKKQNKKRQIHPSLRSSRGSSRREYSLVSMYIFQFFLIGKPLKIDTALLRYQLAFSPVPFYTFLLLHMGHMGLLTRMIHKLFKCQGSMAEDGMRKSKDVGAPGIWQLGRGVEGSERQDQGCK